VLCRIWWYWRDVLVLRRDSREWQLGDVISWCEKQWTVMFWSYVWNIEVSTDGVFSYDVSSMSRLVVWRCLADSVLASAGRCDVPDSPSLDANLCLTVFAANCYCDVTYLFTVMYAFVWFWTLVHFDSADSSGNWVMWIVSMHLELSSHVCWVVLF